MTLLDAVLGKLSLQITCIIDAQSVSSHVTPLTLQLPCDIAATTDMKQEAADACTVRSVENQQMMQRMDRRLQLTLSTLNKGFSFERMAAWHCALILELLLEAPVSRGTTKSTSCSGPPPGEGTPTAAASWMSGTPCTHARSSSTELTCTKLTCLKAVYCTTPWQAQ